jgi:hypothetical protein
MDISEKKGSQVAVGPNALHELESLADVGLVAH